MQQDTHQWRGWNLNKRNRLIPNHYKMVSDISGRVFKSTEMRELQGDQKGLWCHKSEWNPVHPQLKVIPRRDDQTVPVARTEPEELFPTPPTRDDL